MPDQPTPAAPRAADERQPGVPPFRYTARLANEIELAWQDRWAAAGVHHAPNPVGDLSAGFDAAAGRPKAYILDMFPYPSGRGLHVGHPLGYIATDIFARFKRMTGFTVLHAMGYDAFGLPAEQYAVQTGTHPRITTEQNIASMRSQLRRLGLGHDDRRSVATTDVSFYRWTQWIFLQIYNSWYDDRSGRARPIADLVAEFESGVREPTSAANPERRAWADLDELTRRRVVDSWRLAYLDEQPVNWCPMLGTVLANEEVTADGRSERGNYPVYRRPLKQWVLRITAYAERLLRDLDLVDWPEPVKLMQRNWIGRSEGARLRFAVEQGRDAIEVFTTRPDTIFGATYMVLAPEHPLVSEITPGAWPEGTPERWKGASPAGTPRDAVAAYLAAAAAKTDVQRQAETKEKTGVFTGTHAINPATGERVPIFIADYVLMGYGTGAIMAVPGHDERDFEFAEAFDLPIRDVVYPAPIAAAAWFLAHTPDADAFPLGWELAIADFVALATGAGYDAARYPELLDVVRTRRAPVGEDAIPVALPAIDQPGGVGERRGAVQAVWIETLSDIIALGFERARGVFAAGEFWRTRGAPYTEPGVAANSPAIDGLRTGEAKRCAVEHLESLGAGSGAVTYKLRDWLFSRQRYWGEPFPIVFDEHDLPVALPESMLPVELPDLDNFQPEATEDPDAPPRPPLGRAGDWAAVTLDLGDGPKRYRRELNTMPQWAGSCWYYLRYLDPTNEREFCDPANEQHWMLGRSPSGTGVSPVHESQAGGTGVSPVRKSQASGTGVSPVRKSAYSGTSVPPAHPPRDRPAAKPDLTRRRRNLPHIEQGGSTYFVTFRAAPNVRWSHAERRVILEAWRHWHDDRMTVHVLVVMDDHVHAVITPRLKTEGEWWPLSSLMHSVKSYTAHKISEARGGGAVYQDEYYDRVIRDDDEFQEKWLYITDNARRAGLVDRADEYEFLWIPRADEEDVSHGRDARATGGEAAAGLRGGVDLYVGGVEHAVLHLLYARFWHKALHDLGHVSTVEPFQKLYNQGYILAPAYTDSRGVYAEASEVEERDGAYFHHGEPVRREFGKMGKSLKNSVTPDEICAEFGADTLRLYEMYMGPLDQSKPWNPRDIVGMHRFLQRLWRVMIDEEAGASRVVDAAADDATRRLLHKTIAGVRADCESLQFNTAIAKLNEFTNHLTRTRADSSCPREVAENLILLSAPFVPHIADELWRRVGHDTPGVVLEAFPEADPALLVEDTIELAVQALGKVRCRITVPADAGEDTIRAAALADERVKQALAGRTVRKVIVVPGRLVNIVAS